MQMVCHLWVILLSNGSLTRYRLTLLTQLSTVYTWLHIISKMATHLDWSSTWVDEHGSLLDGCIIDCFICWVSGHPTPHLSVKCNCVNVLVSESMHSYESKIATEFWSLKFFGFTVFCVLWIERKALWGTGIQKGVQILPTIQEENDRVRNDSSINFRLNKLSIAKFSILYDISLVRDWKRKLKLITLGSETVKGPSHPWVQRKTVAERTPLISDYSSNMVTLDFAVFKPWQYKCFEVTTESNCK